MKLLERTGMEVWPGGQPKPLGRFSCEHCGAIVERPLYRGLLNKSCGCKKPAPQGTSNWKYRHGRCNTKLYWVWASMLNRVRGKTDRHLYFDRGIGVCDQWKDAATFMQWAVANGYKRGLMLDRKDNDLGYSPDNCRWVTPKVSAQNTRVAAAARKLAEAAIDLLDSGLSRKAAAQALHVEYQHLNHLIYRYRKK